jgi:hypothetical protein
VDYDDRGLVSLPKLVGGPRYSRPPVARLNQVPRPPDPDELPLVSERTPEDHALAEELGIESSALSVSAASQPSATRAAPEEAGRATHPNGSWTIADGTITAQERSLQRGLGLFRGRNGRSGVG